MDDLWASRVHSSKHFSAHPTSSGVKLTYIRRHRWEPLRQWGNQVFLDNSDVNDDAKSYFTCPFCYVDTELSMLCDHLQEEHCFDVNNAVCPVCALNLGKDVTQHFQVHHANSIKMPKRSQKSGFWSFYAGRNSLSGLNTKNGFENVNGSAPDPLLSPFLFNLPYSGSKDNQSQHSCSTDDVLSIPETESTKPMLNQGESEGDSKEMRQRAAFCQQLFFSTIL